MYVREREKERKKAKENKRTKKLNESESEDFPHSICITFDRERVVKVYMNIQKAWMIEFLFVKKNIYVYFLLLNEKY